MVKTMMRTSPWVLMALTLPLVLAGCTGGKKLVPGAPAPALGTAGTPARAFDGRAVVLSELSARGPVMLVLLRGFG